MKRRTRILSALLALILLLGAGGILGRGRRVAPENPIRRSDAVLQVEAAGGGTATAGLLRPLRWR